MNIRDLLWLMMAIPAQSFATDPWIPLFDGKSLAGWQIKAKPEDTAKEFWKVRDGAIVCDSIGRKQQDYVWLISERELTDFELEVKVRAYRDSPGNAGIQIRSRYDGEMRWMNGPQIDIHPPAPWRTGLIYDETRETRRWIFPSLPDWKIKPEQGPREWRWKYADEGNGWNILQVWCRGTKIRTAVNGITIADYDGAGILDDEAHRKRNVGLSGRIALQLHSNDELKIEFKDIRVRPAP